MTEGLVDFKFHGLIVPHRIFVGIRLAVGIELAPERSARSRLLALRRIGAVGKQVPCRIGPGVGVNCRKAGASGRSRWESRVQDVPSYIGGGITVRVNASRW